MEPSLMASKKLALGTENRASLEGRKCIYYIVNSDTPRAM